MTTRSCNLVRATLVACGALGLLTSLATAQQNQKQMSPEEAKKHGVMPNKGDTRQPTTNLGTKPTAKGATAVRPANQAGGGGFVVRGPGDATDDCASAPTVGEGNWNFDTTTFSDDGADGTCPGNTTPNGWWVYTPSADGIATVTTCGLASFDTALAAFTGCAGAQVACNDDACGLQSSISFNVTLGNSYWVRISGFSGSGSGQINISLTPGGGGGGCGAATVVNEGTHNFSNSTLEVDVTSCTFGDTFTEWFEYQATGTGSAVVTTCGLAGFDTALSAWSGCGGSEIACNDDACGLQSSMTFSVVNGSSYWIRVSGYNGQSGSGQFSISILPPLTNDTCDSSNPEIFLNTPVAGSNIGAATDYTISLAQCTPFGSGGFSDVYYRFTAPAAGCYDFETCGSGLDTHLAIFTSCPPDENTNMLACNDDACGLQSRVTVDLTAGQEVYVRVASWSTVTQGAFTLNVVNTPVVVPCVDCSTATVTEVEPDCGLGASDDVNGGCNSLNNPGVGTSVAIGDIICGSGAFNGSLRDTDWYLFTLASPMEVTWSVQADFDLLVGFVGTPCPQSAFINFATSFGCGGVATVTQCLPAGTYYAFAAAQFTNQVGCTGCGGNPAANRYLGSLTGIVCVPPANEACGIDNPVLTVGTPIFGNNTGATTDTVLPDICGPFVGSGGAADHFYQFTAPANETYRFSTCGSAIDSVIAVFSGCPADEFNLIACNDDFCGAQSVVDISMTAGQLVYVRVSSYTGGPTGAYQVQVDIAPPPLANDECDSAGTTAVMVGVTAGDSTTATTSSTGLIASQCGTFGLSQGDNDVWHTFTPPSNGLYDVQLCGSAFDTVLAVFSGCPADANSNLVGCNDDGCGGTFQSELLGLNLSSSTTYYIRVAGYGGATGPYTLTITQQGAATGACCVGGNCSIQTAADCANNGGTYNGDGTNCSVSNYTAESSPNLAIPDNNPAGVTTDIVIGSGSTITDLDVSLFITHTWQGDVAVTLTHVDTGTTATLITRPGNPQTTFGFSTDNYGDAANNLPFTLDDGATQVYDVPATPVNNVNGAWLPDTGPLSVFNGENSAGTWRLTLSDLAGGDLGTLTFWALTVNGGGGSGPCANPCPEDWDGNTLVEVLDIFAFLTDWFANDPAAQNFGGTPGVPAIFAYLTAWFAHGVGPC